MSNFIFTTLGIRCRRILIKLFRWIFSKGIIYIILIVIGLLAIMPVVWTWIVGLRPLDEFRESPFDIPRRLAFENFKEAWQEGRFSIYWINSAIYTGTATIIGLIASIFCGYAFGKLKFIGSNLLFYFFLIGMALPFMSYMIPLYFQLIDLHLMGTRWAIILPEATINLPFGIFLMRTFFRALPDELVDAAKIDGCSEFGVFWRILLPLTTPAVATLGVFLFMWTWNSFLLPLLFAQSEELRPLTVGLLFFRDRYSVNVTLTAAAVTMISLPIVIIFIIFQRQFIRGLTAGALKG